MCFTCSIKVGKKSDIIPGKVTGIPLNGVMGNDFFSLLAWAWCINPQKVQEKFKEKTGLEIDSKDLAKLVEANASGADKGVHKISFMEVIGDIDFTEEEKKKSSCSTILYRNQ